MVDMSLVVSLIVLSVTQAFLWGRLYSSDGPLLGPIVSWIKKRPKIRANVEGHAIEEFRSYGMTPADCTVEFFCSAIIAVGIHHGLGFTAALIGFWSGSPWIFRLGLTFEIGENVLHYTQMAITAISPKSRGIEPWASCPKSMWAFVGIHHLIGLLAGSGAFLVASGIEWHDVHLYVCSILGAILPYYLKVPLMLHSAPSTSPTSTGLASAIIDIIQLLVSMFCRFYLCLPLGLELTRRAYNDLGSSASVFFGVVLLIIAPVFFAASFVLNVSTVTANLRLQCTSKPA